MLQFGWAAHSGLLWHCVPVRIASKMTLKYEKLFSFKGEGEGELFAPELAPGLYLSLDPNGGSAPRPRQRQLLEPIVALANELCVTHLHPIDVRCSSASALFIREDITLSSIIFVSHVECRRAAVHAYNCSDVPVRRQS